MNLHIILHQPEIPHNTGSVIRLAANVGAQVHLVKPLGFEIDDKRMLRAGLDYHEFVDLQVYEDFEQCLQSLKGIPVFAYTTKAKQWYHQLRYPENCALLFGSESCGLPPHIQQTIADEYKGRLPMKPQTQNRSLNLANTVSIATYEILRQHQFQPDFV